MHYEVCKAALEAGLHVVCEKPLCFTSEQADELVKLAEEKHRVVGVTYGYSGHQLIQQARQMIKNGDLGEIRVINMSFAFGGYNFKIEDKVPSAKWRFDPSKAGPSFALGDVGTHPLFIIEAMIPDMKIDNLMCTKRSFVEGRELEDNAFVIMNLKGSENVQAGAQVYCWASSINSGARHYHKIRVVALSGHFHKCQTCFCNSFSDYFFFDIKNTGGDVISAFFHLMNNDRCQRY